MGDKGTIMMLTMVVMGGAAMTSVASLTPTYTPKNTTPVNAVSCVDSDPPSTTDTININGTQYDFIKKHAGISQDKVTAEMKKAGQTNGKDVFTAGKNYFGTQLNDLMYVYSGQKEKNMWIFDVYIKDGIPIPDFIKNCKKIGGTGTSINFYQTSQFPPAAFNKPEVAGGDSLTDPAYIYDDINIGFNAMSQLPGVKRVGNIFVQDKNQTYSVYYHLSSAYIVDGNNAYEYIPTDRTVTFSADARANLQLKWFTLVDTPNISWWTPVCKPAIYLYPESTTDVSVQVKTPGKFTLTIPSYPQNGWNVTADHDGTIHASGTTYPYLYYESTIPDSSIEKPQKGYVMTYTELPALFDVLLPKLGLSSKESKAFKDYWEKVLPFSPYYYVGVMPQNDINALEPLTINPAPDTLVRVRLYFQALQQRIYVTQPDIETPERKGFVVSEWGGMVKLHPGSNFTCVQ